MPGGGERAYAYAKACGIIGKSFVGKRMALLSEANRLAGLDRLVFGDQSRELPERELLPDLESRFTARAVDAIIAIADCFSPPPQVLSLLVRSYEYEDVKNALSASLAGESKKPPFTNLRHYGTVNFTAWPDIQGMLRGTEFEFLLGKKGAPAAREPGGVSLQTALDRRYYNALWKALLRLPPGDRAISEKLLGDEVSLLNAGWALRFRTYYRMSGEEVKLHLVYIPEVEGEGKNKHREARLHLRHGKQPSLAAEALASLELPLDNREAWKSWRWASFLNPEDPGETWHVDPRHFQNEAAVYLYRRAKHAFHLRPFSLDSAFCFIKLKQFEEDLLTSSAEGLGLGLSTGDVFNLLEVTPC